MLETTNDEKEKQNNVDKAKGNNKRRERKDKTSQALKIVVRHLPPTMTEAEFLEQVDPLPDNVAHYYCNPDWSLGQEATCRAYISLKDIADVLQFRDRFDGYVFVSKGVEYAAIVEYAPFQSFVKNKARSNDNKVNSIESEPHFLEFLQKLADDREEASRAGDVKIDFDFDRKAEEKVKSTPLLQYLANKKEKRREEARKRNEEKRKQREEQKQQRQAESRDKDKSKDAGGESKKSGNANAKKGPAKDKEAQGAEEQAKNSRSKRRTERDNRRREQHEQKKLERAKEGEQKNDKDKEKPTTTAATKQNKQKERQKPHKDVVILKKDNQKTESKSAKPTSSSKTEQPDPVLSNGSDDKGDINETVKNFIRAGDSVKDKDADGSMPASEAEEGPTTTTDAAKLARQRASEERRIRNKDRPSIAIYQPKSRGPRKGGREHGKGAATSDGEEAEAASLQDEPTGKKNRRAGRRNRPKPSDAKSDAEHQRVSKSSESSTSANSKIS